MPSSVTDAELPHDLEAERATIAAPLISSDVFGQVADRLTTGDFYRREYGLIFGAQAALWARNEPIELLTVRAELERRGDLEDVGTAADIMRLTDCVPRSANIKHYAGIVKAKSDLRRVIQAAARAAGQAYDGDIDGSLDTLARVSSWAAPDEDDNGPLLVTDVQIMESPDVRQMIAGILPAGGTYGVVGPQGCGKTTFGICKSVSIASGLRFLGHDVVTSGPAIYVALEGQPFIKSRIAAAKHALGIPLNETCGLFVWRGGLDLLDDRSVTRFILEARPVAPTDITIDTWAMSSSGDENSSQDTGRGLRAVQRIRRELGCAVGIVHHTNAGQTRERGSTALRAGLDTLLMLTVADDALRLVCEKRRDGAPFPEIPLRLTPVLESGAQVVRLASDVFTAGALTTAQQRALTRLREDFVDGATSTEWRSTVVEIPERSFYRVIAELERRGFVTAERKGRSTYYRTATTATLPSHLPNELP